MRSKPQPYVLAFILLLVNGPRSIWAQPDAASQVGFGGTYADLRPPQKRLVDNWFSRFSVVVKKPVNPAEGYENLPLSTKTTFNAVTHALLMTKLTDNSGKSLAESALDLVAQVDTVAGQILGTGGDKQFRIYAEMKPGGIKLLEQSKEFKRTADNTVYHHGFPICFRSTGGTPSIQVSLSRNETAADIDVDYRSSKFPTSLVNGHLSSSNSDVRAGGNDARHNNQWAGLPNWWRNLLGIPFSEKSAPDTGRAMSQEPNLKDVKPADAVFGFLNSWLVQQKPNEAIAYFGDEVYACMELERGEKIDRGMWRFSLLQAMVAANESVGKVESLSAVSTGVSLASERVKVIEQPHHAQFVLYDVREDLAEEFNCVNKLDSTQVSAKAMKSKSFGKYVGALFRIKRKDQTGRTAATLWQKEHGYWKLISYTIDPEIGRSSAPRVGAEVATATQLESVSGDKDMIRAAADFLKQWLVKKDIDKAMDYVSPESLPCVSFYHPEDTPDPTTPEEARDVLKKGMARAAAAAGAVKSLEEVISAPEPHHQDVKLVKHGDDKAFVIASIPEYMGDAAGCDRRKASGDVNLRPAAATGYGKYYAVGFSFGEAKTNSGVLWIVWSKSDNSWKARSYALLTP